VKIGAWNAGTLTDRSRELAEVLKRRKVNIFCVQETKWKGEKTKEI
jgi:exonuclease III